MVRLIEWTGMPSIFDNPKVMYGRLAGTIGPAEMRVLRVAASKRIYRSERVIREVSPESFHGLSKTYRFGLGAEKIDMGSFIQPVRDPDWEIIRRSASGKQFRDVTDGIPAPAVLLLPERDIELVSEQEFSNLQSFVTHANESVPGRDGR